VEVTSHPEPDPMEGEFDVGDMSATVVNNPASDDDDDEDEEESEENETDYISVNVIHDERFDVVKISCDDPFGYSSIPLYCDREKKIDNTPNTSLADDRNGVWDWLIHMSPDMTFTTRDPDRWLKLANDGDLYENQIHMCILDEENGLYLMGVYVVDGIYEYTLEDDEPSLNLNRDFLARLNNLICSNIGLSCVSHYPRSVSMWDNAKDESYMETVMVIEEGDDDDGEEGEDMTPAEKAALRVIMGTDEASTSRPEHMGLREAAAKMAETLVTASQEEVHEELTPEQQESSEDPREAVVNVAGTPVVDEPKKDDPAPEQQVIEQGATNKPGVYKPIRRM